jgi:enoyl-CoA hydratase/carnithine racemase
VVSEIVSAGGLGVSVTEVAGGAEAPGSSLEGAASGIVHVAVHRTGRAPQAGLGAFDVLLSADPVAPAPWVGLGLDRLDEALGELIVAIERQPVAASVAAQVYRMTLKLAFDEALVLESLAYSTLLASAGFKAWRVDRPQRERRLDDRPRVALERGPLGLAIRLTRTGSRNAVDARMRDELVEALEFALLDPDAGPVTLCADGPAFSAGGDLDEFGTATDPGQAHAIRTLQSATRLAHSLAPRLTARLHGSCVGAGIEMPAAAGRVLAREGTTFRLPEVSMGLIPGAGGTASIPRRIGRQRACYMAISGIELDPETALRWGLVDGLDAEA